MIYNFLKIIVISLIIFFLLIIIYLLIQFNQGRLIYEKFQQGKNNLQYALLNFSKKDYSLAHSYSESAGKRMDEAGERLSAFEDKFILYKFPKTIWNPNKSKISREDAEKPVVNKPRVK